MMKHTATVEQRHELLSNLQHLPRNILRLHGTENIIPEFVLHELCNPKCFNVHKAAYFVDNPDFDCLKGVVGINHNDDIVLENIWDYPEKFSQKMKTSPFNQKVKTIIQQSPNKKHLQEQELIEILAKSLNIEHPKLFSWNMKYDNIGMLIIEENDDNHIWDDIYMVNSVCLLGFCPVH